MLAAPSALARVCPDWWPGMTWASRRPWRFGRRGGELHSSTGGPVRCAPARPWRNSGAKSAPTGQIRVFNSTWSLRGFDTLVWMVWALAPGRQDALLRIVAWGRRPSECNAPSVGGPRAPPGGPTARRPSSKPGATPSMRREIAIPARGPPSWRSERRPTAFRIRHRDGPYGSRPMASRVDRYARTNRTASSRSTPAAPATTDGARPCPQSTSPAIPNESFSRTATGMSGR